MKDFTIKLIQGLKLNGFIKMKVSLSSVYEGIGNINVYCCGLERKWLWVDISLNYYIFLMI